MRILFINPPNCGRSIPEERYGITSLKQIFRGEPLALEVLAGNLGEHDVHILDLKIEPDGLQRELASFNPELVGLTAMTCEANTALRLAREVKQSCSAKVVVGGIHASCDPGFFNRPDIDWITIGLGKQSLKELVESLTHGDINAAIAGVAPTRPGKPLQWLPRNFSPQDLADHAPPRYDLVANYRTNYTLKTLGLQIGFVTTAVGCPFDCSFCCIGSLTGNRYLTAGTDSIIRDIKALDQSPVIRLVDANSFADPVHAQKLGDTIEATGIRKQFLADVRADTVVQHPELFERWKEIGLRAVIIGLEEICDETLNMMEKESCLALNLKAIETLHGLGLTIVGDFIISPDYDEKKFDQLADFTKEQQIDLPIYSILTPLPGTRLYQQLKGKICIHDLDYYTLTNAVLPTHLDEELFYRRYANLLVEGHKKGKV